MSRLEVFKLNSEEFLRFLLVQSEATLRSRFYRQMTNAQILNYSKVATTDLVYGFYDKDYSLVGVGEIIGEPEDAELALIVSEKHRGKGYSVDIISGMLDIAWCECIPQVSVFGEVTNSALCAAVRRFADASVREGSDMTWKINIPD